MVSTLKEFKENRIKEIERLISTAGLTSYDISEAVRGLVREYPDLKDWAEKMYTWRDTIERFDSVEAVEKAWRWLANIVDSLMKIKHEKELKKSQDDKKWWEDYYKKQEADNNYWKRYLRNELDWQKDQKKREEENDKKLEEWKEQRKKDDNDFNEKNKKKYIADIEMDLVKKNISGERLSKRLGVSDWKEKVNEAADSWEALSRRSDLWDVIRKLKDEYTCASCGVKKEEYTACSYRGEKCCSYECEKELRDKDKKDNPSNRNGKFGNFDINGFFNWMKKMRVAELKFDFDKNQVVIKLNSGKNLDIKESGLSSEEQENLTQQLKSTNEPITFSEIDRELNRKEKNDNKDGKAGIIAAVVIVGLILAVIIGVVIGRNKKKDDY